VLKGMQQSIAEGRIKRLSFELNKCMLQGDAEPLLGLLKEFRQNQGARFSSFHQDGTLKEHRLEELFEQPMIPNIIMNIGG
jgi:hypothetical protein